MRDFHMYVIVTLAFGVSGAALIAAGSVGTGVLLLGMSGLAVIAMSDIK